MSAMLSGVVRCGCGRYWSDVIPPTHSEDRCPIDAETTWWDGGPLPPRRREGPCQCDYRWGKYSWSGEQWWRRNTHMGCPDHGTEATQLITSWQRSPEHRAAEADWLRRNRPAHPTRDPQPGRGHRGGRP